MRTPHDRHLARAGALITLGALVLATGCGKTFGTTLQSISITPDGGTLAAGARQQFSVIGRWADGTTGPITRDVQWTSSDPSVATIDANGVATAVASSAGTTTLTARVGSLSERCALTVTAAPLQSITVAPGSAAVATGLDQQFVATGHFADGTSGKLTGGVGWSSSSSAIAAIDAASALAHAVSAGPPVTITATDRATGISGTATLTVTSAVLRAVTVTPGKATIAKGLDRQFTATGLFSDGTTAALSGLRWTSSSDAVATVDSVGLASAVAPAPAAITITATDPATGVSGAASLTVTDAAVTLVTLTPPTATLTAGFAKAFTMTGFFSDNTTAAIAAADVTWTSSDAAVATFDASGNGVAYGVAAGSATITATHRATGLSAFALLTVNAPSANDVVQDVATTSFPGVVNASGLARFRVLGLQSGGEYLVRLTPTGTSADPTLLVQVHAFATFDAPVCTAYAATVPCRGAAASPVGELFVLAAGLQGTTFTVDVTPLPVLHAGAAVADAVDRTETYYKVDQLTAGKLFLADLTGLADRAELFVYDGPHGPFGSKELCASLVGTGTSESCSGTVPGNGAVYVTVQGWLTASGTPYTIAVGM